MKKTDYHSDSICSRDGLGRTYQKRHPTGRHAPGVAARVSGPDSLGSLAHKLADAVEGV